MRLVLLVVHRNSALNKPNRSAFLLVRSIRGAEVAILCDAACSAGHVREIARSSGLLDQCYTYPPILFRYLYMEHEVGRTKRASDGISPTYAKRLIA